MPYCLGMRFFRIHDASRLSPELLLDAAHQVSRVWTGEMYRRCDCCDGSGRVLLLVDGETLIDDDGQPELEDCDACRGSGEIQISSQRGVSVCRSLDDLEAYLSERSAYGEGVVLVELEGDECDEQDIDADHGALLVTPTRIVSVGPVPEQIARHFA